VTLTSKTSFLTLTSNTGYVTLTSVDNSANGQGVEQDEVQDWLGSASAQAGKVSS